MTSKEAIRYQLKNLKGKPWKQKLKHIITYFWAPILAIVLLLIFISSYTINLVTTKDSQLNIICINAYAENDKVDSFITGFAQKAGIDLDKYAVNITTKISDYNDPIGSYEISQLLFVQIAAQELDVVVSTQDLSKYIYQEAFAELNQVLSLEQQERYEQYFLYMDKAFLKSLDETYAGTPEYPDPTKPELMEEPVPVALLLPETGQFRQLFYSYEQKQVAVGIAVNSINIDNAEAFLEYIME